MPEPFRKARIKCFQFGSSGIFPQYDAQQDIVVTGVGMVSPIGIGKEPFWAALLEGRSGIRRLDLPDDLAMPPPIGGPVVDFDPKQYVRPRKSLKVMSRDIQLAFAAADLACIDAGLREKPVDPERLGVVFGAEMIPCELDEMVGTYRSCFRDGKFDFQRWGGAAMADLFPLWMLKYLPNMPACHIGIGQDARGPNNSITLGDVSSLSALAEAGRILERGQADAIIAGGVGARLHPALWVRGQLCGMSHRGDVPRRPRAPSTQCATAWSTAKGPAAFILETEAMPAAAACRSWPASSAIASAFEPCPTAGPAQGTSIRRAVALRPARRRSDPGRNRMRRREWHERHRRRPHRGPGDPRDAWRRAGDGAEELFRPSRHGGRLVGDGRGRSGLPARPDAAHAQLRKSRSGVPRQRCARAADVLGPSHGPGPQPFPARPGGGDGAWRMSDMANYSSFAGQVKRLDQALAALGPRAAELGVPSPEDREWHRLLRNKLLAQLDLPPLLIVAIVGGTNIGKSAIFNHIAGEVASASNPLAAGTKHPVCLCRETWPTRTCCSDCSSL